MDAATKASAKGIRGLYLVWGSANASKRRTAPHIDCEHVRNRRIWQNDGRGGRFCPRCKYHIPYGCSRLMRAMGLEQ